MADGCQPHQRNLYQTKFSHLEYRDGSGTPYSEALRNASWPTTDNVPAQAQRSMGEKVRKGKYDTLHPCMKNGATKVSFVETHGLSGPHPMIDVGLEATERLYTPKKTQRPKSRSAESMQEEQADAAFQAGNVADAIDKYTLAIEQKPNLYCYEKRAAAWCHVGKYKRALADAEYILAQQPNNPKAALRVQNIQKYLDQRSNCELGYQNAHVTLITALTPTEFKQW